MPVEGCRGRGRSARSNRKTDAHDAHSIAMVAVRTTGLRVLRGDSEFQALRLLVDRREALTRRRIQIVGRLQALLAELLPGQSKKDITTGQAKAMLVSVRPRDIARQDPPPDRRRGTGRAGHGRGADEEGHRRAQSPILARGSHLMDLPGVGPVVAARVLADVGDVSRFANRNRLANRNRFASRTGTAPLDASSVSTPGTGSPGPGTGA